MNEHSEAIFSVLTAIIGVAIVAVVLSTKSQTSQVIGAAATGFGSILGIAISPITGNVTGTSAPGPSNAGTQTPTSGTSFQNLVPVVTSVVPLISNFGGGSPI